MNTSGLNANDTIHLNVQTNCNLSFSLITIENLIKMSSERNLNCLSICDYQPYDFLKFYYLCKKKKIKPIWGIKKVVIIDGFKVIINFFPKNYLNFKKLNKFFYFKNEFNHSSLKNLGRLCLIVFEAKEQEEAEKIGELITNINNHDCFKDESETDFYIGLNFFPKSFKALIEKFSLKILIPFFSVKFLEEEERICLETLKESPLASNFLEEDYSLKSISYLEKESLLSYIESNLKENSNFEVYESEIFFQLFSQIENFIFKINISIGCYLRQEDNRIFSLLESKCLQNLHYLKKDLKEEEKYKFILEKELNVIKKLNYSNYFINLSDIINAFYSAEIEVGPGRGSAVSSLVSYLLNITQIDPIQHNLFFWRFLNEGRKDYPDVDIDVENQNRAFEIIRNKYGKKFISKIIIKKKLGWVNAIKLCLKIFKMDFSDSLFIEENPQKFIASDNNIGVILIKERYRPFFDFAKKICNFNIGTSTHASGLIISNKNLSDVVPIKIDNEFQICLHQNEYLSNLGFKKYDFLSLTESLGFINYLKKKHVKNIPDYRNINLNDERTWNLLNTNLLTGIFQIDTPSFKGLISKFKPRTFFDLVLLISMNRPGSNKNIENIIQKRNLERKFKIKLFSSCINKLNEILDETLGNIIFEEQVTQIFSYCLSVSFSEGEILRKKLKSAVEKKDGVQSLRDFFNENSLSIISNREKEIIWNKLFQSACYMFNKAHAVSYAYLTYYTAYLKVNFFSDSISYLLNRNKDNFEKMNSLILESILNGYEIIMPEVNNQTAKWVFDNDNKFLFVGSSQFNNSHQDFFTLLIEERDRNGKFENWENFIERTVDYLEKIHEEDLKNLIKLGFFRSLDYEKKSIFSNFFFLIRYIKIKKKLKHSNSKNLPFIGNLSKNIQNISVCDVNRSEWESLNLYISYIFRWKKIRNDKNCEISTISKFLNDEKSILHLKSVVHIKIYAIILETKKVTNGYWLTIYDFGNIVKIFINNELYNENRDKLIIYSEFLFLILLQLKNKDFYFPFVTKIREIEVNCYK
jgi:DNA polymerase III subunit alpha